MNLLLQLLIVLTICVSSQDTTRVNIGLPDTSSRESKRCVVKQIRINQTVQDITIKLDSITVKFDKRIEDILKSLDR